MSEVDGNWAVAVKTPLGEQKGTLTVQSSGDSFTGRLDGDLGSKDVTGTVDGNRLAWDMEVSKPMPLSLSCTATVDGDKMTGEVSTGAFGAFPLTGSRA